VHGCIDELLDLYDQIERKVREGFQYREDVWLVFLGDYVDRGHNSKAVLDFLIQLTPDRHIILPGNHDQMMRDSLNSGETEISRVSRMWFRNGGLDTLASYAAGENHPVFNPDTRYDPASLYSAQALIPEDHKAFLTKLFDDRRPYFKDDTDKLFFVHAGIDPSKRLSEHSFDDFLWSRHPSLMKGTSRWVEDHLVIHGHTVVEKPLMNAKRASVDTGCVYGGRLSAALFVDGVPTNVLQSLE
jgi:serine/threonine protein phosphatase 1